MLDVLVIIVENGYDSKQFFLDNLSWLDLSWIWVLILFIFPKKQLEKIVVASILAQVFQFCIYMLCLCPVF